MTPRRVLVTGAAGFVGQHMMASCRAAWPAAQLHAACRMEDLPAHRLPTADSILPFDLLAPESIAAAVASSRPDVCIHLAARADVAQSFKSPGVAWAANVDGTRALAGALCDAVPEAVLLNAGSAEVYGLSFQSGQKLDETARLSPANPYAASKAAIDLALGEMALRGLRVIRMRPLNHVGPGQSPSYAIASFARQIAGIEAGRQEPVIRTGALDRERDFLDVRDVCAAYVSAINRADILPAGSIFNIASETVRQMGDVLATLLRLSGVAAQIDSEATPPRPLDIQRTRCSAAAAREALGWAPRIAWETTLQDILSFWRHSRP